MIIRHPAGLYDITEEVAGIGTHRPPGIEEGEREGETVVEEALIHLKVHVGQVVTLVGEGQLPTRPLRIDGVRPVSARRVAEVERTPIEEPTPASTQRSEAMLGRYLLRDIAEGRPRGSDSSYARRRSYSHLVRGRRRCSALRLPKSPAEDQQAHGYAR